MRPGDQRDRKGEPPQKRTKVDRTGVGDAVRVQERVEDNPQPGVRKKRQEKCPVNTLLHMRGNLLERTKSDSPVLEVAGCDDTDFNHNINNSKSSDSKRVPPIDEADGICNDAVVANGKPKPPPNGRLKGDVVSGKEEMRARDSTNGKETDGVPKQSRKKEYTPIKEYSMREQTKLQTRVTKNSIKDLFNAKRAKVRFADTGADRHKSEPALPNLPTMETNGVESFLSDGNTSQGSDVQTNGRDNGNGKTGENALRDATVNSKTTCSANGRTASQSQRCESGSKSRNKSGNEEVSYGEWLSRNGCVSESMQEEGHGTGKACPRGKSSGRDRVGETSSSDPWNSFVEPSRSNGISKRMCDGALGNLDHGHPSSSKVPSSQDSDVSMASVDLNEDAHVSERGKSGDGRGKERGKVKPPKGSSSSRKPPRKSEDTILKYMELLSEEQQRLKQEEADRLLAERLQKQFDKESRRERDNVDRSKGTEDAYKLRENQRPFYNFLD